MGFKNDISDRMDMKTVDYDRGIVMRSRLGPGPSGNSLFEIQWHSDIILFNARVTDSTKLVQQPGQECPAKFDFVYEIRAISMPKNFPESEKHAREIIDEALSVFGEAYSNARVNSMRVQYVPGAFEREVITKLL